MYSLKPEDTVQICTIANKLGKIKRYLSWLNDFPYRNIFIANLNELGKISGGITILNSYIIDKNFNGDIVNLPKIDENINGTFPKVGSLIEPDKENKRININVKDAIVLDEYLEQLSRKLMELNYISEDTYKRNNEIKTM